MDFSRYFEKRELNPRSRKLRIAAVIWVVYICIWVYMFIPFQIYGSIFEGVWWSSGGGGMLFPIPLPPGIASVIGPANPLDSLIYLVFLQGGIWVAWLILLGLYVFSPYAVKLKESQEVEKPTESWLPN